MGTTYNVPKPWKATSPGGLAHYTIPKSLLSRKVASNSVSPSPHGHLGFEFRFAAPSSLKLCRQFLWTILIFAYRPGLVMFPGGPCVRLDLEYVARKSACLLQVGRVDPRAMLDVCVQYVFCVSDLSNGCERNGTDLEARAELLLSWRAWPRVGEWLDGAAPEELWHAVRSTERAVEMRGARASLRAAVQEVRGMKG